MYGSVPSPMEYRFVLGNRSPPLVYYSHLIGLGEANRRSKARLEHEIIERQNADQELREREKQLRESHLLLENRVEERTAKLARANESLRLLSARLLQLQDDERRRIARELHDSAGQLLAAISMSIGTVSSLHLEPRAAATVAQMARLVDQTISEIRTMSYLLHPPLLDEAGLPSALRLYVKGFAERSGISVSLDIGEDFDRLPREMEIALFRIVQESLTNIHRHSGSPTAAIRIAREPERIDLEVRDAGRGMPPEKQQALRNSGSLGVGFRGMNERIAQLGGNLEIESDEKGTVIRASLPLLSDTVASSQAVA